MRRWMACVLACGAACSAPAPAGNLQDEKVRARDIQDAIRDGVAYLQGAQNRDGSWGSARGTTGFDVWASVPGAHEAFRMGTTALAVMALMEAKGDAEAIRRGEEYLLREPPPRRANSMELYNVWAHGYAIQALALSYQRERQSLRRARIRTAVGQHLEALARHETAYGGWNYYDFEVGARRPASSPTSFGTAAVLVALLDARRAGLEISASMARRAAKAVMGCRKPDGSYLYDLGFRYWPHHLANCDKGSLGRTQACNVALYVWGEQVEKGDLIEGMDRLLAEHRFLELGRKRPYPHEAWYFTSGYYYYFGHYYAARALELLDPEDRRERRSRLEAAVLPFQEADGSWWDYAMYSYHRPYGAAFAVMTLLRCLDGPYRSAAR
ncbi:MAG: hypothetical protein HY716_07280 [Planctomycetes bacterium]|nr:hypothetical protein [Planctomycetota bacterium]